MNFQEMVKNGDTSLFKNLMRAGLILVTGYMTWSFLQTMMGPDGRLVAILGLIAFEGGMIFWEKYYNDTALSSQQVAISGWMILVDLTGVALAFIGEVMFNRPDVQFPSWLPQVALMGTTAVVIANVAAFIGVSVFDPRRHMDRADRQSQIARMLAEVKLKTATAAQIMADSDQLAIEMAPGRSRNEIEALRQQYGVPVNGATVPPPFVPSGTTPTPTAPAKSTRPRA